LSFSFFYDIIHRFYDPITHYRAAEEGERVGGGVFADDAAGGEDASAYFVET
jgi:hypothetical protein